MFETEDAFLNSDSRFSPALAQRLSVLILLLAVALMTTSCGTLAQANGTKDNGTSNSLNLSGNLPPGTVNESYNTVLAVGGGSSPYHFSVKTGALPPGIRLHPATGTFSGKPTTAGTFSFEVIVTDSPHLDEGSQTFAVVVGGGRIVNVSVSPASAALLSNQKQQFTATVSGTSNTGVTWSAAAGSVDASGLYTAPAVNAQTNVVVTATSNADFTKSASASVTVNPVSTQSLKITTANLPQGQHGNAYSEVFAATGGTTPYSWSISAGTPPARIAMNANGDFAGMPTAVGTFNFTVTVTDAANTTATGNFSVTVIAGSNVARTDTLVTQLPIPMPTWGGANGAGTKWIHPSFSGTVYTRLTDATMAKTVQGSLFTADSGEPQLSSSDDTHFIIRNNGGRVSVIDTQTTFKTGVEAAYDSIQFSSQQPLKMLALDKTRVRLIMAKPDWSGIASDTVIFDYASAGCLGTGFRSTWHAIFTVSKDDLTFKTAFSDTGGQGSGHYVVAWSAADGCYVYDTVQGTVTGPNGLIGSVTDANGIPLADRFYLHEAGNGQQGAYAMVTATIHQPSGASGCVAGNCSKDAPYVWTVKTNHVVLCDPHCDGHSTKGVNGFYTGAFQRYHLYSDPSQPLTPNLFWPVYPTGFPDQHGSAHNEATTGLVFITSQKVTSTPITSYPVWGFDEVIGVTTDGSEKFFRFGQTLDTGESKYFICQNAITVVGQLGHKAFFTSDMGGGGVLGYEADGVTPRCDVFMLEF
jgi:hypothetical protein